MGVGASILSLLGKPDPREQLLQSIIQAGDSSAQYAAQPGSPAATAGAAGGAASTPDPQPEGMKSPPDLSSMYGDLMKYQARTQNIDRGFGLIGSAISQDGNRESTLRAFTGDGTTGGTPSVEGFAQLAQGIQKANMARQVRAAQLAALPTIAKRYGLDPDTARMMFESGGLDEIIKNAEKPDRTTMAGANGQLLTIDQRDGGQIGNGVGPVKPRETINYEDANGQQVVADKATGDVISTSGPMKNTDPEKIKLYNAAFDDFVSRNPGKPNEFPSLDEWLKQQSKAGANNLTIDQRAENREAGKIGDYWGEQYVDTQKKGQAAQETLNNYELIEKGLQSGVNTGTFGESELALRKLGQAIGIENADGDQKIAGGELIQKIGNKMALLMRNPESGMGMPGSLSDKDLAFLKESQLGLSTSEPGNKLALEVFRRMEQRKIAMADAASDWVDDENKGNGSMKGFDKYWRNWSKSHPMFDDIKVSDFVANPDKASQVQSLVDKYRTKK